MNRIKSWIVLSLMLFVGGQMMGQTGGTLFLGATFPMGDYSKVNGMNSTALYGDENQTYGGAGIGFNAGLKWDFGVGVKGLDVILSVDGLYNGPSTDMKELYKEVEDTYDLLNNNIEQKTPKYINVPAMLGLRFTYNITSQLAVYGEGAAGANARFITGYSINYTDLLGNKHTDSESFKTAFSFAYQFGLGIVVSDNLVLGGSFYSLGSAPVKGEAVLKTGSDSVKEDFTSGTLFPKMILARIGFRF